MPEPAVLQRVAAGEPEDVVGGAVLLHLRKNGAEIVRVKEALDGGVGGQRGQRFLRGRITVEIVEHRGAVVGGLAVQTGILRLAAGRKRLQAANIDWIDGYVGLHSGGRGSAQCRLIVDAVLADAVAEINDSLLLRDFSERLHDGL